MPRRHYVGGNPLVVERIQRLVADDEIPSAGPRLELESRSTRAALSWKNRCRVVQSPSTRARWMKRCRDSAASTRAYPTVRARTIGTPYSVTRSVATALPCFADHRGSEYDRLTRCSPACSAQRGSMRATSRAQSRGRLDQLTGHDELRLLAEQAGARRNPEPGLLGAEVLALDFVT